MDTCVVLLGMTIIERTCTTIFHSKIKSAYQYIRIFQFLHMDKVMEGCRGITPENVIGGKKGDYPFLLDLERQETSVFIRID